MVSSWQADPCVEAGAPAQTPWTVSQVNQRAKQLLEGAFPQVMVVGEVSGLKVVSGHRYFTLKDERAQLSAVLFRRDALGLRFDLKSGTQVLATGRLTVYPPYGRYQMVVDRLEPRGAGALQAAFEQLKERLRSEGLFEAGRKRPLPRVPRIVGVVTSLEGAVLRDIVRVATRRFPRARLLVFPTRVQGAASAGLIQAAIDRASKEAERTEIDVLIVARGGGSLEDLWGFNDERVARAIARCGVAVVSAVGHETDFTIADFVADARAPTPSAAAELIFPVRAELLLSLETLRRRSAVALRRSLESHRHCLRAARLALGDGRSLTRDPAQRLAEPQERINARIRQTVVDHRMRLADAQTRLAQAHPRVRLRELRATMERLQQRLGFLTKRRAQEDRTRLQATSAALQALSPLAVLERGYAIVLGPDGTAVREASCVQPGERLDVKLARGQLEAVVANVIDAPEGKAGGN